MKTLRAYQERAVDWLYSRDHALLYVPMGAGKTAIVCKTLEELIDDKCLRRVLVVAPKRVALTVWPRELDEWSPDIRYVTAIGTASQRAAEISKPSDIVIINYENLIWLLDQDCDFDCVVFDEITRMKSAQSKRFKAFIKRRKMFKMHIGMTGTPSANGLIDMYAQVKCIDGGRSLGKTITGFRNEYFDKTGPLPWQWQAKPDALDNILDRMHDLAFQIDDAEYDLPDLVDNVIEVDLPSRDLYNQMEKDLLVNIKSEIILAANGGVRVNKLQQICNGFIYNADGYEWLHDAKLDALEEVLESQQGAPTLVVYKYAAELQEMQKRFPGISITGARNIMEVVDDWNAGRISILYVHPASAGHGLNLQQGGNTIVWFGHTWSREEYDQIIARLRRSGQSAGRIWNHLIVIKNSVDGDIALAQMRKLNLEEAVTEGIRKRWNTAKQLDQAQPLAF